MASGSVSGADNRCASRREPAEVTVRSIESSNEPRRSPASVRISSRLPRVAWSMAMDARRAFAQRRRQRRAFADLRALDVGDAGRGGGQLQPRQRAEGFAGRHREERGQPPLGAGAIEHVAGSGVTAGSVRQ